MTDVEGFLINVGNLEVLTYLIPLGLFIWYYMLSGRSPWMSSPLGKALAYQKISFTAVILVIIASIFFPGYFGRGAVRIVIYFAVGVSLWVDFANLMRYQRLGRAHKKKTQFLDESTKPRNPKA